MVVNARIELLINSGLISVLTQNLIKNIECITTCLANIRILGKLFQNNPGKFQAKMISDELVQTLKLTLQQKKTIMKKDTLQLLLSFSRSNDIIFIQKFFEFDLISSFFTILKDDSL